MIFPRVFGRARTEPVARLSRPTFGTDCTSIMPCRFTPAPFVDSASQLAAGAAVRETALSWCCEPRSQADGLRLAFGDAWRIDLLPSTAPEEASYFLLTHHMHGFRLLVRMRRIHYRSWCFHPDEPTGGIPSGWRGGRDIRRMDRREWLALEVCGSVTATRDLLDLVRLAETRASGIAEEADRAQARAFAAALVEVWLAETGANATERAAVRAMVALGSPLSSLMGVVA